MSKPQPLSLGECAEKAKHLHTLVDAVEVITRMQVDHGFDETAAADGTIPGLAWIALDIARELDRSLGALADESTKQSEYRAVYDHTS